MLNSLSPMRNKAAMRGFTLIEMMIAILIGLIVSAGAFSLIVAINRANSDTIGSTRLNDELRALASLIADDIKRTRRLDDPIATIGQGTATQGPYDLFDSDSVATSAVALSGDCLVYGYQGTIGNSTADLSATANYRAISRRAVSGVGAIWLAADTVQANATCTTTSAATVAQLSSTQVNITALRFTCVGGTGTDLCKNASEIDLTITGSLSPDAFYTITRTFTQPIFVRSDPVKTS